MKIKQQLSQIIHLLRHSRRTAITMFVICFGVFGAWLLVTSHAGTPTVSLEAEGGTISSAASTMADMTASGNSAVKFGVSRGGTTNPNCTPDPEVTAGFPNNCNTGVPAGTTLTTYTGAMTIASGTIDSKTINGDIDVTGTVTIQNSRINGDVQNIGSGTLTLTDDEFVASDTDETDSVIFGANIIATRLNVHGGKANIQCQDGGCVIRDSYLHDPWLTGAFHYDVVGSNGVNGMTLDHNSLQCKFAGGTGTGGCSADLGFFGDFATIQNITINNNLFMASSDPGYCVITNADKEGKAFPVGQNLVWTNNVFQRGTNGKCGFYGAVDDWVSGNGNVWTGNKWDDGTALNE